VDARLRCGPFEFDRRTQTVRRDGIALPALGNRAAALLEALLRRPGEILTKTELLDAAWSGVAVEEANLTVQIANLRKALGPASNGSEWITTVHRVGYRFDVPAASSRTSAQKEASAIAVLPFVNIGVDPAYAQFGDGLAEDIITALLKTGDLTVIARNSSFAYRGANIDLSNVGEELDVHHVVTGSVRTVGTRARIGVRLAEPRTGAQLWAETYDRELGDIFSVQDDVTAKVADAVVTALGLAAAPVVSKGGTRNARALDLYRRGRAIIEDLETSAERNAEARAFLEQAIACDPHFADALVYLTITHLTDFSNDWGTNQASLDLARASADAAIAASPETGSGHGIRSVVAAFDFDPDLQDRESACALALDPNQVFHRACYLVDRGEPERAIPLFERAIRINPATTALGLHYLARAYLHAERYQTAAAIFRARISLVPNTDMSRALLCVALGHLGEVEEAKRVWAELMAINPRYSLEQRLRRIRSGDPQADDRKREGLRKAGLPVA
jgi:TolB-like protein